MLLRLCLQIFLKNLQKASFQPHLPVTPNIRTEKVNPVILPQIFQSLKNIAGILVVLI